MNWLLVLTSKNLKLNFSARNRVVPVGFVIVLFIVLIPGMGRKSSIASAREFLTRHFIQNVIGHHVHDGFMKHGMNGSFFSVLEIYSEAIK